MKPTLLIATFLVSAGLSFASAQSTPDLTKFSDSSVWRLYNRAASAVPERENSLSLDARSGDGTAWLVGSNFSEGTIDVDLRGANKPGQSFIGIAFRGVNDSTFDAIYFRPFNFQNPDASRRPRSVQYISQPNHPWEKLRAESPGKYEAAPSPVPDPDDWFHARIVVEGNQVSVYVNNAAEPSLVVGTLSDRQDGVIGLWVGNGSAGDFANLKITPKH
jgi:hypothetical protein